MSEVSTDSGGVQTHMVSPFSPTNAPRNNFIRWIYEHYAVELRRFLKARYGDGPPEPHDVTQQAFARIAALEHPQTLENPRAFLYRTAINIAIDCKRRDMRQERILRENSSIVLQQITADSNPERVLLGKDQLRLLRDAVERLPERERTFLLLNRLEGVSFAEIARRTAMAPSSVRYIIERALEKCQVAVEAGQADEAR